jgi:hypothetical protein
LHDCHAKNFGELTELIGCCRKLDLRWLAVNPNPTRTLFQFSKLSGDTREDRSCHLVIEIRHHDWPHADRRQGRSAPTEHRSREAVVECENRWWGGESGVE